MQRLMFLLVWLPSLAFAQFKDDFSDGNFTQNPVWFGATSSFLVNSEGKLQSNGPNITAEITLMTASSQLVNTEWTFYAGMDFSPSNSNHARIYLISDSDSLKGANGYFVRLGEDGSLDGVDLYRQQNGSATRIIKGRDATLTNSTRNTVRVKVIRDALGNWSLYSDVTGGSNFVLEGSVNDTRVTSGKNFGVFCSFTQTRRNLFFFDDFEVKNAPFSLLNAQVLGPNSILVNFSEDLGSGATQTQNYLVSELGNPSSATIQGGSSVRLEFAQSFEPFKLYTLTVNNLRSVQNVQLPAGSQTSFRFVTSTGLRDIIFTEIFADPSPVIGLPEKEFVEIYNRSDLPVELGGIEYSDRTGKTTLPAYRLAPKSYLILCARADTAEFSVLGQVLGLSSWPSLNNTDDLLSLKNTSGVLIDQVEYTDKWYGSTFKKNGGFTLEIVDTEFPCLEPKNWKGSEHPSGGTPGRQNSVAARISDSSPPAAISVETIAQDTIIVGFDEFLDETQNGNYVMDNSITVNFVRFESRQSIRLTVSPRLEPQTLYKLQISGLADCLSNKISTPIVLDVVLPEVGTKGEVIINEIQFNPPVGGTDFVEVYNPTSKFINLKGWKLAERSVTSGVLATLRTITENILVLPPDSYWAFCTDTTALKNQHPNGKWDRFFQTSMPNYNADADVVVLMNEKDSIIDEFSYTEKQHFTLIRDVKGVSLERISPFAPTQLLSNWKSASSASGYGTPGYLNSQSINLETGPKNDCFSVEPEIFTPDGDGQNDFTLLKYNCNRNDLVVKIQIYDAEGWIIKDLAFQQTLSAQGFIQWDGTDNQGRKAKAGIYAVFIEAFDLTGYREKIVLRAAVGARR
jgi:hypothetical protein